MTAMLQLPPATAVLLAGGGGSRLYPLNAGGTPKVLLPVANRPLLTFPLRMLEESGVADVLVVCEGDMAAQAVRAWLANGYTGGLKVEVARVAEGLPAVDALRAVLDGVATDNFVLLSGDVVSETSLRAQLLTHYVREAAITALLGRRKVPASAETKPGRPPRNVDYIGLTGGDRLSLFVHSPETVKQLVVPPSFLRRFPSIEIRTDLVDMQVYVFHTATLRAVLAANERIKHLEEQLVPHMVRFQLKPHRSVGADEAATLAAARAGSGSGGGGLTGLENSLADLSLSGMSSGSGSGAAAAAAAAGQPRAEWYCGAYLAPEGSFCQRANTLQGFADCNRDVITPANAARVLREEPSPRYDNFVSSTATLGARATVAPATMVGDECALEDRVSVKRTVVGAGCQLGAGSKIVNSVVMDDVRTGPSCAVHNCVLSQGCVLGEGARLRDCYLAPGYAVPAGAELTEEVLPAAVPPRD
ncbi:translation initiation factor eIF-2B subunit gamma [Micractinium conductrix]|uniref:Translation initiation factor eIF2B subunit gamma n=1 Tax=Micractinium conductrix TaxID=554055 RepID=A0A2P6V257_9CHLO|nr:translation initiation factor eIF-2B subunit gamma [Micractinium conductrix]|eukprot:PSC68176.1 translation initiation factor eIF-2B subunit gamma [Micractinium conductrix]